jgi:hypothetical protein
MRRRLQRVNPDVWMILWVSLAFAVVIVVLQVVGWIHLIGWQGGGCGGCTNTPTP